MVSVAGTVVMVALRKVDPVKEGLKQNVALAKLVVHKSSKG